MPRSKQILTATAVMVLLVFAEVLFAPGAPGADLSARPPAELQQQWNDMMLEGRFGRLYNGDFYEFHQRGPSNSAIDPTTSFLDMAHGWVHEAYTPWGIEVTALKEHRHLIRSRGGWVLEGGLLQRLHVEERQIELYGKTITRHEPYLNPLPHVWFWNESWKLSHEFFLVARSKGRGHATVLRQWVIADAYCAGDLTPRGLLEYDNVSDELIVTVTHGHYAGLFRERVNLRTASAIDVTRESATRSAGDPHTHETLLRLITMPAQGETAANTSLVEHQGYASFEEADGWVNWALQSKESIRAEAGPRQRICAGLIRRMEINHGHSLELYARVRDCGGYTSLKDFFLFLTPSPHATATLLRHWTVPRDGPGKLFQRAFLGYDPGSGLAQVRVTDGFEPPTGWDLIKDTIPVPSP
jgi:hypothetical protein